MVEAAIDHSAVAFGAASTNKLTYGGFASTIKSMDIEFNPAKSAANEALRGLPFDLVAEFDFDGALFAVDNRKDYGEVRIQARGMLRGRLHVLVFTETPNGIRVISLRKANQREVRRYEQET